MKLEDPQTGKLYKTGKMYVAIRDVVFWKFKDDRQCRGHFSHDRKMWAPGPSLRGHIKTGEAAMLVSSFNYEIPVGQHRAMYKFLYGAEIVYMTMIEAEKLCEL